MYIVLSGVHGIGKTTIARELAERLGGVFLTESIDEAIPPPILGKSSDPLRAELWFVRQMILKEAQMSDPSKIYVADRGWSDIMAYANVVLDPHALNLFRSVFDHLPKRYPDVQLVVHAPLEVVVKRIQDRHRDTIAGWSELDRAYVESISKEFLAYHEAYKNLRSVYLLDASGTVAANCATALDILKPHLSRVML